MTREIEAIDPYPIGIDNQAKANRIKEFIRLKGELYKDNDPEYLE